MSSIRDLTHHATCAMAQPMRKIAKRPLATAGVVLLAAGAIGLYLMWPEIQRYAKIKRM